MLEKYFNTIEKVIQLYTDLSLIIIIRHAHCSLVFLVPMCVKSYMLAYDINIAIEQNSDGIHGVYQTRPGQARPGQARPGQARPGQARPGQARPGQARPGQARPGQARPGQARPGQARPGQARPGQARPGQGHLNGT